jgi:2-keto-4-pentenoate hydratase/2-oxohepta-3-ene-1,7-dioic acid hydratase in catechol pathway
VPHFTKQLDYEIEIAIIIGKPAFRVSIADAMDYVAGYTIFNDLSARDIQAREHSNKVILLGKSFNGSCPFGPHLVTPDELGDPHKLAMQLKVNGVVRQDSNTSQMHYKTAELVSWWSNTTLEPGDIITSGSPPGVAAGMAVPEWLKPGDLVEANIEKLGTLTTHIVAGD